MRALNGVDASRALRSTRAGRERATERGERKPHDVHRCRHEEGAEERHRNSERVGCESETRAQPSLFTARERTRPSPDINFLDVYG